MNPTDTSLRIAEIFESVQGEGQRIGTPSLFIRISGCNLRCVWCDTPYASWEPEGPILTVREVVERVAESNMADVVVTGGEPMIFEAVVPLCQAIRGLGKFITIETAGTVYRNVEADLMSISPKLSNSIPVGTSSEERHRKIMEDRSALKEIVAAFPNQLKFVVTPDSDSNSTGSDFERDLLEIDAILAGLENYPSGNVFLMPEGRSYAELWARARKLVPICMDRGFRLAPRIQIDLFGDTRGT